MTTELTIAPLIARAEDAIRVSDKKRLAKVVQEAELTMHSAPSDEQQLLEAMLLHWRGMGYYFSSRFKDAIVLLEQARAAHRQREDRRLEARSIKSIGACYQFLGDYETAMACMRESQDISRSIGDRNSVGVTAGNIANLYLLVGDYTSALRDYEEALAIHRETGDTDGIIRTTGNIGNLFKETGRFVEALRMYDESIEGYQELQDAAGVGRVSGNIGGAYYAMCDYASALEWYHRSLRIHEELGDRLRVARMKANISAIYADTGDAGHALEILTEALAIHEEIGDEAGAAHITGLIGMAYIDLNDPDTAIAYLERAVAASAAHHSRRDEAHFAAALCSQYIAVHRLEDAERLLETADRLGEDLPAIQSEFLVNRAELLIRRGRQDEALALLHQALEDSSKCLQRRTEAVVHHTLRSAYKERGPLERYVAHTEAYEVLTNAMRDELQQRRVAVATAERRIYDERRLAERQKTLLYNALPPLIADRLVNDETDVAELHDDVCVLFMDIVNFTEAAQTLDPRELIRFLNSVFTACDEICSRHGLMKIKTIGDSYMAVAFKDEHADRDHIIGTALAAQEIRQLTIYWPAAVSSLGRQPVQVRIGLHIGSVVSGVVGTERLQYDVWGDTVNVASRLESTSEPDRIHISERFANNLSTDIWHPVFRGVIDLKGKGLVNTYWLE